MDIIKCTDDDTAYNIWDFIKLSPEAISHKRRHLICPSCGAKAYYRKRSTDGKPACFGARPHNAECDAATSAMTLDEQNDLDDVNKVVLANDAIRINFDLTIAAAKSENKEESEDEGITSFAGSSTKKYTREPSVHGIASRGLKTLLNYMLRTPAFQNSTTKIYTDPNRPAREAKELFIKFDDAKPKKRPYLFWGMITHADKNLDFLNTGGKDSVSIPVSRIKSTIIKMAQSNEPEDFAGAYVMVFGWCNKSEKGKDCIHIDKVNPGNIFIKMAKKK